MFFFVVLALSSICGILAFFFALYLNRGGAAALQLLFASAFILLLFYASTFVGAPVYLLFFALLAFICV